jgi:hypothetical protein
MLDRSPRRSVPNFRDRVGGGSVNMGVLKFEIRKTDDGGVKRKLSRYRQGSTKTCYDGSDADRAMDWIDIGS